jgi:ABC-type multidrug transport system fused ATPase/permease subunit
MNGYPTEEKDIGKVFDRRIAARLLRYMRPFIKYLAGSALFLVIAASVELSYPFLIKTSIDNYIVKGGKIVQDSLGPGYLPLGNNR